MAKKTQKKTKKKIAKTPQKDTFKIKPLHNKVLIKEDTSTETTTAGGIIIPMTVDEEKGGKRGIVVAVGSGGYDDGILVPMTVEVGNKVLFSWGDKIKVDGEEYYLVKETEILAIIN